MQNKIWVKICGLYRKKDISYCYEQGINAVGFLLKKNKKSANLDQLTIDRAKTLVAFTPEGMESCLLIHSQNREELKKIANEIKPTMIQVQSPLNPRDLRDFKLSFPNIIVAKTFSIESTKHTNVEKLIQLIHSYIKYETINFVLLDSKKDKKRGGTGTVHDWKISARVAREINPFPVILAGGLNPDNFSNAIKSVKPFGIDIMTGVSTSRGIKSHNKIKLIALGVKHGYRKTDRNK